MSQKIEEKKKMIMKSGGGVSDASMIELRAVLAETSYRNTCSHAVSSGSSATHAYANKRGGNNKAIYLDDGGQDDRKRQRIEKDKAIYKEERNKRSLKNVTQSLKKKSELYDRLASSGDCFIPDGENDQYLVDFSKKKNCLHDHDDDESDRIDDDLLVKIEDEFGRLKYVKENSSEYRCYTAEKSRQLHQEEMRNTPGFGIEVDPTGSRFSSNMIAPRAVYNGYDSCNSSVPYKNDAIQYNFPPIYDDPNKESDRYFHNQVKDEKTEKSSQLLKTSRKVSAKEKKAMRLELIRQKQMQHQKK